MDYFWQQQEYFSGGVRVPGDGCSWLAIFVGNFLRILGFQLLGHVLYIYIYYMLPALKKLGNLRTKRYQEISLEVRRKGTLAGDAVYRP